jgi:hypothetical protein
MMTKIDYDVDSLVGELLSKDGFFIDLIGCEQFTFWYLLRQIGIRSYAPIIGTTSFIFKSSKSSLQEIINSRKQNIFTLFANASRYFNTNIIYYNNSYKNYQAFIKEAILKGRFVYALYDTSFDSLKPFDLDYSDWHGYALVGFDDEKKEYRSIFSTSVKYEDLENMLQRAYIREGSYKNVLYYIDSVERTTTNQIQTIIKKDLLEDLKKDLEHWKIEFQFFLEEIEDIRKSEFLDIEEQCDFIAKRNNFYNMLMVGGYGNFVFKIRCFQELYGIDVRNLEEKFSQNRKESLVIANMFRKALIKIERNNQEYYANLVPAICDKINSIYIKEGKALYESFCDIVCPLLKERSYIYESLE